jgi:endonuclease/exonuclease/phosphatase family metal-dependent hydrolase
MGDFNAGCRYLNAEERSLSELFQTSALTSLIDEDADTTTTSTFCPYDRMLIGENLTDQVAESGVYRFDQLLGLTGEQTRAVSDHYPVWARF